LKPIMKSKVYIPKVASMLKRSLSIVDLKNPKGAIARPKNREANIQGILRYFCIRNPKNNETIYVIVINIQISSRTKMYTRLSVD